MLTLFDSLAFGVVGTSQFCWLLLFCSLAPGCVPVDWLEKTWFGSEQSWFVSEQSLWFVSEQSLWFGGLQLL